MNDGGPAFPVDGGDVANGGTRISVRDYFAASADEADVSQYRWQRGEDGELHEVNWCVAKYLYADAMLEAREAKHDSL